MPIRPPLHRPAGDRTKKARDKAHDGRRGSARQRGYTTAWDKARKVFLTEHPLCRYCEAHGLIVPATVVDHIKRHGGDAALFWDTDNWQPLCQPCHNSVKQSDERRGFIAGCDAGGRPVDPYHPWNRGSA